MFYHQKTIDFYVFSFGQILSDLFILTDERIILQLYEITQMFVDFLQRYDNMSKYIEQQIVFLNSKFFFSSNINSTAIISEFIFKYHFTI